MACRQFLPRPPTQRYKRSGVYTFLGNIGLSAATVLKRIEMAAVASLNSTCNCVTNKSILVTDAGGFIDANFALEWLTRGLSTVVTLDKLTYAGNLDNLESVAKIPVMSSFRATSATANWSPDSNDYVRNGNPQDRALQSRC